MFRRTILYYQTHILKLAAKFFETGFVVALRRQDRLRAIKSAENIKPVRESIYEATEQQLDNGLLKWE